MSTPPSDPRPDDDDLERRGTGWVAPGEQLEPADFAPAPVVRRGRPYLRTGVIIAVLLLAGTGIALAITDRGPDDPTAGPAAPFPVSPEPSAGSVSAPLSGRTRAVLDLLDGTQTVRLRTAALDDELYRVTAPTGSNVRPAATTDGDAVRLSLVAGGGSGPGAVDIVLSTKVRWDIRLTGGTQLSVIDLSGADIAAVELNGGASRINLTLPRPDGTLRVRMTGGVGEFLVHTADRVPVRVRVGSGAGRVELDGRRHDGVPAGQLFTPARWDDGGDRIDLDAVAGVSALKVD